MTNKQSWNHPDNNKNNNNKNSHRNTDNVDDNDDDDGDDGADEYLPSETGESIDMDSTIEVDTVSDAEALLACRAYLSRKNKLDGGWKHYQRRKQAKQVAASQPYAFFWEDPTELIYLQQKQVKHSSMDHEVVDEYDDYDDENDDDDDDDDNANEGVLDVTTASQQDTVDDDIFDYYDPELELQEQVVFQKPNGEDYEAFTSFPSGPSETRIRRSKATKKLWADPEWRQRWYESRWGGRRGDNAYSSRSSKAGKKIKTRTQKQLEERIRSLPPGFLGSQELAEMTEAEIADAIKTYIQSKARRAASLRKSRVEMKEAFKAVDTPIPRDSLLTEDADLMKEQRQKRAERAKKSYETRLKNSKAESLSSKKKTRSSVQRREVLPLGSTPEDAAVRAEYDLDQGRLPRIRDVKILLQPAKFANRRVLLRRILSEGFDLRGKCVPADFDDPNSPKEFVTQCSISDIGEFVVYLMQRRAFKQQAL